MANTKRNNCHACREDFGRRGRLVEDMTTQPPDVVPTVEDSPKRVAAEAKADDDNMVACLWCARESTENEWLRRRMLEKNTTRALSRGPKETQDAPVNDGGKAKLGRRSGGARNFHASSASASSRARRDSRGTRFKQALA
ncbi:hypothetical protein ERJ75_000843100 [Trypanosoma vivax]|nr:hypothetical protein ERJ75_000843100 [Trypanosoma vivax]